MVVEGFERSLDSLRGTVATISDSGQFPEPGTASIAISFSDGSRLRADYWRVVKEEKARLSSFDHRQKYGLPAPIDAIAEFVSLLDARRVKNARWDSRTGDLIFDFEPDLELHVFNFTGFEVWEIQFPNGTGEYSNYAV
jgi:hypothetical protein